MSKKIYLVPNDFLNFKGGWSLAPCSIFLAIKHLTYVNELNILEFGSGDGTTQLVDLLTKNNIIFNYTSVEHDESYAKTANVNYQLYHLDGWNYNPDQLDSVNLTLDRIYDLVIIDGPHGVGRAKWYSKIKNNIRKGTVLLVDDFHHYVEFSTELDTHFEYETINVFNYANQHIVINEGTDIVDATNPMILEKSYKVAKILNIK